MAKQAYVLEAKLVGWRGVRRTIAVRGDQTLVDLHYALEEAFEWDDDHLYSFWLDGRFWGESRREYTHPWHAAEPGPLAAYTDAPPAKSAAQRLDRLRLRMGQPIAYIFDFGDEWRVKLSVADITAADDGAYPRLLGSAGEAPPQYPDYDEKAA